MSNPASDSPIEQLLRDGIKAARAKDNATARDLLEQVLERDQHNEKAWFWLAAVVDDPEEKRVCLGNVIVINPDNKRAQRLLDQLEGKVMESHASHHSSAGGSALSERKNVYLVVAAAVVGVLVIIVVLLAMSGGDDGGGTTQPQATVPGLVQRATATDVPAPTADDDGSSPDAENTSEPVVIVPADATATTPPDSEPASDGQPTPSPSVFDSGLPTMPPAWTAVPSATAEPTPAPLGTPPAGLPGKIIMQSGTWSTYNMRDYQPIVVINADGSNRREIVDNKRGYRPVLSPDGQQCAYVHIETGTYGEVILKTNNLLGSEAAGLNARWGITPILFQPDTPAWSNDGEWIAFVAIPPDPVVEGNYDLFMVSMRAGVDPGEALQRLTSNEEIESWPAFNPTSTRLAYVARFNDNGAVVTELRVYDLRTQQISRLTTNGNDLVEAAPDWSPNGETIIFQAHRAGEDDIDIYQVAADGLSDPQPILELDSPREDIQPRFSPDGQHIVFSSNRLDPVNFEVFIFSLATKEIWQVTNSPVRDIANDWSP